MRFFHNFKNKWIKYKKMFDFKFIIIYNTKLEGEEDEKIF